jgi:PTS system mannose-specific IIA component/PTS system mannose-specific IIB component
MNILLVSHGKLCEGVLDAFSMLVSGCTNISSLSLTESGVEDFRGRLEAKVAELTAKGDLLILADLKGGTPYNEAYVCLLKNPEHIRLAGGLNLPMVLEAGIAAMDSDDLDAIYKTALEAGSFGVQGTDVPAEDDSSDEDDDLF